MFGQTILTFYSGYRKLWRNNTIHFIISGTEMDFVENKLSAEFVFNNPNIKGTCGCGESFSI